MKLGPIPRLLLFLLGIAALTMLAPLIVAAIRGEREMLRAFGIPMGLVLLAALSAALPPLFSGKRERIRFGAGDGFLLVFLAWVLVCLLGAAPYVLSGHIPGLADAVFESVSGFTTTGATVIIDVEIMPRSLLLWRAMTHWLGGMGIVVLTVAILPLLGVGGFQLLKAESSGPNKEKITPKITATAKLLWLLYIALTALQTLLLRAGGMNWFDAVTHAFSTIATGGFSTRNDSLAAFESPFIDWVCTIFMILAGLNFTLLLRLFRGKYREILNNSEARAYGLIILVSVCLGSAFLFPRTGSWGESLRLTAFHTASILTSTGFSASDYTLWPPLIQGILFFLMWIGGCSGSTAGGIKVIRHVVLWKQAGNEMKRLLYPRGVFSIRLDKQVGRKDVVYGVAGFVFFYIILVLAAALLVSSSGVDIFSSLTAALITLGNIGLGLGRFGPGSVFTALPDYVKWGLSFVMIAGRLELWTVFVFFSPDYWRR
jgi:trk system potassium uptake protein TrkH